MNNINNAIILSLVTLILIVFLMNYKEKFTNLLNTSINKNDFVTDDISNLEVEEVVPDELQVQTEELVDQILERFNRDYNKKLIRISIERVERDIDENKTTNFKVWVFVFNYKKESNGKVLIEFTLNDNDIVRVSKVDLLGSRESIITTRGGETTRVDNNLKQRVNMDKVEGLLMAPIEFSGFNVSETPNKMVDRNNQEWYVDGMGISIKDPIYDDFFDQHLECQESYDGSCKLYDEISSLDLFILF